MTAKIERISEDLETAKREYDQELAALRTRDSLPIYSPEEEKRRRDEI